VFGPTVAMTAAEIAAWFTHTPEYLDHLSDAATALAPRGSVREVNGGAILIGPRPDIGALAYDVVLHPPISPQELGAYEHLAGFVVPPLLSEMLLALNGCKFFELSVYGVPLSMTREPPLLDRSTRAPLDLGSGRWWRVNYLEAPESGVLFASRNVSDDGQVGFFLTPTGAVVGVANGKSLAPQDAGSWPSLSTWWASQLVQ
jgi:hypothetical protein